MKLSLLFVLVLSSLMSTTPAFAETAPKAAQKKLIFVPSCNSAEAQLGMTCLDEKQHLSELVEKNVSTPQSEVAKSEIGSKRLSRRRMLLTLPQLRAQDGTVVDLAAGLKDCSGAVQAGDYCKRKAGKVTHIAECTQVEGNDPTCKNLNRKQLAQYMEKNLGVGFTSKRELATLELDRESRDPGAGAPQTISKPDNILLTPPQLKIEVPKSEEAHQAGDETMQNQAQTDHCASNVQNFIKNHPETGAKFVSIQGQITANRLLYAFIYGAKLTPEDKRSETFGIKAAVTQLLKQREEFKAEAESFRKQPVSTAALSKVLPEIQKLLSEQSQSKAQHPQELVMSELDVKLLGWLAEGPEGKDSPTLKFAKLVNSKVVGKDLSNDALKKALKTLKADQAKLDAQMDQLIKKVADAESTCQEVQDCRIVSQTIRGAKNLEEINLALYKSLKLSSNDLPDLFEAKPTKNVTQDRAVATSTVLSGSNPIFWTQLGENLLRNRDSKGRIPYGRCSISDIRFEAVNASGHFQFKVHLNDQISKDYTSEANPTAATGFAKATEACWKY